MTRKSNGQFGKGNKGKPKGTVNKKTRQWNEIGDYLVNGGSDRFMEIMENSDDDKFKDMFLSVLNYFKPKLASTTNKNENTNIEIKKTIEDGRK